MAFDDDLRELRTRISQATQRKARGAADLEAAAERRETTREALKTEYGADTPEAAKKKLAKLKKNLEAKKAEIETQLQEAGA